MSAPDMSIMPPEGSRRQGRSRLKDSKHDSNHRSRSRKHYPLLTMPHSHRGKRKLYLDLECEWDRNDSTLPCIDVISEDCTSLDCNLSILSNASSSYNLPGRNPLPLRNLRQLCDDFSFSLDSLNDNLNNPSSGPSPLIETTLHCPFAAPSHATVLPTVNIHERLLEDVQDPGSSVNLSDYDSEADDEREETENCEEEIPLIVDSDCSEDDSLQEFFSCPKYCDHRSSCSDIPFQPVSSSVSTISASNSLDSIPTTSSSNESLNTVSTTSLSSELYECPENYEMLYRNFEIAARMEENQGSLESGSRDANRSLSSNYSSDTSAGSNRTFTSEAEGHLREHCESYSRQNRLFPPKDTVTTFAKLADSKRKSPVEESEIRADSSRGKSVTHWTEVLSKQCHSSKDSPESGINSPVDPSPESPKVKRPYFLPLPLRHIQRPAAKPIAISAEEPPRGRLGGESGLPRTFSAPTGGLEYPYADESGSVAVRPSVLVGLDNLNIAEEEERPAQETGDLISWTQSVKQLPSRSLSVEDDPTSGPNTLLDWGEDVEEASRRSITSNDSRSLGRSLQRPDRLLSIDDHFSGSNTLFSWRDVGQAARGSLSSHDSQSSGRSSQRPNVLMSVEGDHALNSATLSLHESQFSRRSSQHPNVLMSVEGDHSSDLATLLDSVEGEPPSSGPQNDNHCLKRAPLIDWEDIFTSRQSFCELESPEKKQNYNSLTSNECVDINANFSVSTLMGDGHPPLTMRPKFLEDKAINTSPFKFRNCNCGMATRNSSTRSVPTTGSGEEPHQQKEVSPSIPTTPPKPKPTLLPLRLQSVDYFSDSDDSLSSLESLEMDDCVFRESLYSLTSEHLYQSQTFTQVTENDIQEDSLCENTPPPRRSARVNPKPRSKEEKREPDGVQELYNPRSVLPTCLSESSMKPREGNIPGAVGLPLHAQQEDKSSPIDEKMISLENRRNEGVKRRLEDLYQLNFISQETTPKRVIKHKPLKPICQVDAEYRCRKVLEQLTKPSHSLSAPSLLSSLCPQTIFVATNSTQGHLMVPPQVRRDDQGEGQEDILEALPPQEMPVSPGPKADKCEDVEFEQKRGLVLAVKSAIQQIVQYFDGSTDAAEKVNPSCAPLKGDIHELVLSQLCPSIEALVRDGMKLFSNSWLVGRVKNTPWIIVQATTQLGPGTRELNDLYNSISGSQRLTSLSSRRFNAFVMGLLNNDLMCNWMEHCRDHPNIMGKYYEASAFFSVCNTEPYVALFQDLLAALGHLSELPFQLDYLYTSPSVGALSEKMSDSSLESKVPPRSRTEDSPRRAVSRGERTSWSSYVDSKKLTSNMWSLVGKVKKYTSIQGPIEKPATTHQGKGEEPVRSPQRGECDGGPAEEPEVNQGLEERIASEESPERRWSASWIQGFANAVPKSEQDRADESLLPAPKTWSEVFKAAKWQRFGSGWSQMMPKLRWRTDGPAGTPVPPLYERQVTGCGTPVTGLDDVMTELTREKGNYSNVRTQVKTRCHYVSLNPGELSFMKGDILTVRGQPSNEWLHCSLGTKAGLVHVDYIQELD